MSSIQIAFTPDAPSKMISIKRFEELFELEYYPQLKFADWRAESWIRKKCGAAYKKGKIQELALWLGKFHGKQIEAAEIPDITIRWIGQEIGYGLFTNRPLEKWEYIGEYTGLVRPRSHFFRDINDYCFMYPHLWIPTKSFTIDSQKCGNYTRFINHNDSPNCESISVYYDGVFHIIFRAIEEIPANTELTYDYGDIYWNNRKKLLKEDPRTLVPPEAIP
ncbi:MAG: hypothetical protein K940chlam9_00478 [Chlamydiae bacterium]|nr:hypothetical protein [Chlamydiota bacterium]